MIDFKALEAQFFKRFPGVRLFLYDELDSTSAYLKNYAKHHSLSRAFCLTKHQSAGYGQRSRSWQSQKGDWLFSVLVPVSRNINDCHGLSSVIGVSILQALSANVEEELFIKWPNDLWTAKGKFCGILVETVKVEAGLSWFVIGIGINLSKGSGNFLSSSATDYDFSSITLSSGVSEHSVLLTLIDRLMLSLDDFSQTGIHSFLGVYKKHDKFQNGESVIVYDSGSQIKGFYRGLDSSGKLLIEIGGELKAYYSGSISIRPNTL